jgi:hypothetical protein
MQTDLSIQSAAMTKRLTLEGDKRSADPNIRKVQKKRASNLKVELEFERLLKDGQLNVKGRLNKRQGNLTTQLNNTLLTPKR